MEWSRSGEDFENAKVHELLLYAQHEEDQMRRR